LDLCHFSVSRSYTQSVGLLGRRICPNEDLCLHTWRHKHRINANKHSCLERDSNPQPQSSRERTQLALSLWSAVCCDHTKEFLWMYRKLCRKRVGLFSQLFKGIHEVVSMLKTKLNSVAWVRERTISTDRPPFVGEISANFCG
jgi:hypothetical protein